MLRMAYVQTPFRISFFGGGTDFPAFFNEHGGAVLGTTINRYSYVALNLLEKIKDNIIKLTYSKLELVKNLADVKHPIVRCALATHQDIIGERFLDIHSFADLPSKSGIGSSSAFTVGLLQAFNTLCGQYRSPEQLAYEAIDIERNKLQDAGGWQDQIMCAYGGFNHVKFKDDSFTVAPVILKRNVLDALEDSLLFFYTQEQRSSSAIQNSIFSKKNIVDKRKYLFDILGVVDEGLSILRSERNADEIVQNFGHLLDKTWKLKSSLGSGISSANIDSLYKTAINAGAYGGKVCGAGGGGFMFFSAPADAKENIRSKLAELGAIGVEVKFSNDPSKVLFASGS